MFDWKTGVQNLSLRVGRTAIRFPLAVLFHILSARQNSVVFSRLNSSTLTITGTNTR